MSVNFCCYTPTPTTQKSFYTPLMITIMPPRSDFKIWEAQLLVGKLILGKFYVDLVIHFCSFRKRTCRAGADPELDFGGAITQFYCIFHVRSCLLQWFAIGDSTVREGPWPDSPPLGPPLLSKQNLNQS